MSELHRLPIRVYYEDTDMAGVVYYANYLKYIERGRSEAIREIGVDQVALRDKGTVFVVRRLVADYLKPARFDDVLTVETCISWIKRASLGMAQRVLRDGQALFTADVTLAAMDLDGRPTRLPPELLNAAVQS